MRYAVSMLSMLYFVSMLCTFCIYRYTFSSILYLCTFSSILYFCTLYLQVHLLIIEQHEQTEQDKNALIAEKLIWRLAHHFK